MLDAQRSEQAVNKVVLYIIACAESELAAGELMVPPARLLIW